MDAVDQGSTAARLLEQFAYLLPYVTPWLVAVAALAGTVTVIGTAVRNLRKTGV